MRDEEVDEKDFQKQQQMDEREREQKARLRILRKRGNEMNYNNERTRKVYEITKEEAKVAQKAYDNKNSIEGETALVELTEMVLKRNGTRDILFDVCADWDWRYTYTDENREKLNSLWEEYVTNK